MKHVPEVTPQADMAAIGLQALCPADARCPIHMAVIGLQGMPFLFCGHLEKGPGRSGQYWAFLPVSGWSPVG